jgi:hypothetical protein
MRTTQTVSNNTLRDLRVFRALVKIKEGHLASSIQVDHTLKMPKSTETKSKEMLKQSKACARFRSGDSGETEGRIIQQQVYILRSEE